MLDLEAVTIQIRHVEKKHGIGPSFGPTLLSACGDVAFESPKLKPSVTGHDPPVTQL